MNYIWECENCANNKNEDNEIIEFCEICKEGYCILCTLKDKRVCENYKTNDKEGLE